jgi:oligopeptide/dipeptide ABC transporter ATP-binding protein
VPPLLDIRNLSIEFPTRSRVGTGDSPVQILPAVRDLNFSIAPGEVLGLVGESGSGKSITSLAIMRLLPPQARVSGDILLAENGSARNLATLPDDSMRQLRGSRLAMIFQEPMTALNPVMRVGDQIAEAVLAHGSRSRSEAQKRAVQAMNDVAIPEPQRRARDYPHQLSGGMRQRVMIAMAIVNRPQLLIADEPTTALDVTIQAQILDLLAELQRVRQMGMLLVTHDLGVVATRTDRIMVMYAGRVVELAPTRALFANVRMPYTEALLSSIPRIEMPSHVRLAAIPGRPPDLANLPTGCAFAPRCSYATDQCRLEAPPLTADTTEPDHFYACWHPRGTSTPTAKEHAVAT